MGRGNKLLQEEEGKGGMRVGKPEGMVIVCPRGDDTLRTVLYLGNSSVSLDMEGR